MSIQDRIETREESGFVQAISPDAARRQFKISATLVAALAVATVFVAALGQVQPRYSEPATVKLTVQAPGVMQVQQAHSKFRVQPGG